MTGVLGVGLSSSGDNTAIVPSEPVPGGGGGVEPAPVLPPPGDFIAPSTPTLIGAVQGISVVWNGLNSAGDLWPSDTSYVEVHMDTSGTATLGTATLKGRLARPGGLAVTGLSAGTTYYFRLRGADAAGNVTAAGTAASGQPGLINAPDIAANAITANSIVAGTITGWDINAAFLSGGTISGGFITGGTVSGGFITGGTVQGSTVQSSNGAARIVLNTGDTLDFFSSNVKRGDLFGVTVGGIDGIGVTGALDVSSTLFTQALNVSGANADFTGVTTGATTADAGFNGDRLRKKTSSQRYKYDIAPLTGSFHADVDAQKQVDVVTVDPSAILELAVAEFSWLEEGLPTDSRDLGFIAEDVAAKFPLAVGRAADGTPIAVRDTPILAALVAVVRQQQSTITDLRTRIEALEA
jgi:hypothetical protein